MTELVLAPNIRTHRWLQASSVSLLSALDDHANAAGPVVQRAEIEREVAPDVDSTGPGLKSAADEHERHIRDGLIVAPIKTPGPTAGMWSLFLGLGLLMIGNGLNGAVIGVRSGNEGFSVVVTGVIMAGYFAGFLLAPSLVIRMISSVGHIRVFAGLASTASSAVLVHAVSVVPITWTLMRFVFGFCFAGLYIVIESWLGELTTAATRGRTMATYMIVSMGGLGIGQYLIAVADPNGFRLFVASSVLVSMALVPVTLAPTSKVPITREPERVSVRELISIVPTGVIGSLMSGAATGVLLGLAAVYSSRIGLSIQRTAGFLLAPTIGAIVFQWPIGNLSDRISRRLVIYGVVIAATGLCVVGALLPNQSIAVPAVMFGLGGMMFPLYSLVVSYTLDWTAEEKTVGAAGTLVRINGTGALLGPLIAAALMSFFGSGWFFWTMASFFGVVVVYLTWRISFKDAMPQERQRAFVPFPARATALAFQIIAQPVRATKKVGRVVVPRRHNAPVTRPMHPSEYPVSEIAESDADLAHRGGIPSTDW